MWDYKTIFEKIEPALIRAGSANIPVISFAEKRTESG
jgi:hypothetical protein